MKLILTETQIKKIVNKLVVEQAGTFDFDETQAINAGTKKLLDTLKIPGSDLTSRINEYQRRYLGIKDESDRTGHMIDMAPLMQQKQPQHFKMWRQYIDENKPVFDKLWQKFKTGLGIKRDPNAIY